MIETGKAVKKKVCVRAGGRGRWTRPWELVATLPRCALFLCEIGVKVRGRTQAWGGGLGVEERGVWRVVLECVCAWGVGSGSVAGFGGSTEGSPESRCNVVQLPSYAVSCLCSACTSDHTCVIMWGTVLSFCQIRGRLGMAALLDLVPAGPTTASCPSGYNPALP